METITAANAATSDGTFIVNSVDIALDTSNVDIPYHFSTLKFDGLMTSIIISFFMDFMKCEKVVHYQFFSS